MAQPTILVPVNRLAEAKERLSPLLASAERAELARITMETVVRAAAAVGHVVVLTNDPAVEQALAGRATILVESPALRGLNAQLEAAIETLVGGGVTEVLVLHADLPLATPGALRGLVEAAPVPPSVTIARPPDGGTNAMLLRPPGRFRLAYGKGSCDRHIAAAREVGMAVRVLEPPELTLDLDTPGDVRRLLGDEAGRGSPAGQYLEAIGVETRPAFATAG